MDAKKAALKQKFKEEDKNGDGVLSFAEFSALMNKGKNRLSERELRKLFNSVAGQDGKMDFEEFVEYCFTEERSSAHQANRTTGGRHARMSQSTMVSADTDGDWLGCQTVYDTYLGNDYRFEGRDWMKMCTDCKLIDKKFSKADVDLAFAKYKVKGQNTLSFENLQQCIRSIAMKKGVPTSEVQQIIAEKGAGGPTKTGTTKAEYVEFYDNKEKFTGVHAQNENFGHAGAAERSTDARHERLRQAENLGDHDQEDEADWEQLQESFLAFCNGLDGVGDNMLDSREFKQLCEDCSLYKPGKFTIADGDIIFNKVKNKGERRIEFDQFKDACVGIARKRGCAVSEIQAMIGASYGPQGRGNTKADYVRFHDDKSTYTGMHVGKG